MTDLKLRRGVIAALVGGAVLVGITAGLYAGRVIARDRPTCGNAIDSYYSAMLATLTDRQREMMVKSGGIRRDEKVRACREGRWSEAMKRCWARAGSLEEIDACPNEWLNAATICEQMKREGEALARRCRIESGAIDCKDVRALGFGIKTCIEALRDAECNEIEQAKENCKGVLLSPN